MVPTVFATDPNIVAMIRYRMAVMRSKILRASLLKAFVAISRASWNLFSASKKVSFVVSSKSIFSLFSRISAVTETFAFTVFAKLSASIFSAAMFTLVSAVASLT